jgi:hypothetical protein
MRIVIELLRDDGTPIVRQEVDPTRSAVWEAPAGGGISAEDRAYVLYGWSFNPCVMFVRPAVEAAPPVLTVGMVLAAGDVPPGTWVECVEKPGEPWRIGWPSVLPAAVREEVSGPGAADMIAAARTWPGYAATMTQIHRLTKVRIIPAPAELPPARPAIEAPAELPPAVGRPDARHNKPICPACGERLWYDIGACVFRCVNKACPRDRKPVSTERVVAWAPGMVPLASVRAGRRVRFLDCPHSAGDEFIVVNAGEERPAYVPVVRPGPARAKVVYRILGSRLCQVEVEAFDPATLDRGADAMWQLLMAAAEDLPKPDAVLFDEEAQP